MVLKSGTGTLRSVMSQCMFGGLPAGGLAGAVEHSYAISIIDVIENQRTAVIGVEVEDVDRSRPSVESCHRDS